MFERAIPDLKGQRRGLKYPVYKVWCEVFGGAQESEGMVF